MTMTKTELRVHALRLSVERRGPNTIIDAREYLSFLMEDYEPAKVPVAPVEVPQSQGRRK
jgi:hypothetical protein